MDTIVKSDFFFFITGVSVILLTLFWLVFIILISFFGFKILRNIKIISNILKEQTEKFSHDFQKTRETTLGDVEEIRKEVKNIILFFFKFLNMILEKISKTKGRKNNKKNNKYDN